MRRFKNTKYGDLTGQVYEGDINVSFIQLTSLEGAPKEVHGNFNCSTNNLTNLKYAPEVVNGDFKCFYNNLNSLEGAPREVYGNFDCFHTNLTTLKGAPKEVYGTFFCSGNKLENLKYAPKIVHGDFDCRYCSQLKSLDELLSTEIKGKLKSNIMTDKEFRELQKLYDKAGRNMKKLKLIKKLKGLK